MAKLLYQEDKNKGAPMSVIDFVDNEITNALGGSANLGDLMAGLVFLDDTASLDAHVNAYCSLTNVYDQVAAESFNFIDKGNYVLYNEYITAITANLNVGRVVTISQESIETLPGVVLNHHIALEGLIADIWTKIKAIFNKIYEAVKGFFAKYFTRVGNIKRKLENLKEVLGETTSDIKTLHHDNVPSDLASKYPINGPLTLDVVRSTFSNVAAVGDILNTVNTKATAFAKKDVLDANFVAKVKSLKDLAASSKEGAKGVQDKLDSRGTMEKIKGVIPGTNANKDAKEMKGEKKNLEQVAKDSEKEAAKTEGEAIDTGNSEYRKSMDIDDTQFNAAKKEFQSFMADIETQFAKMKGKPLVNGQVITKVEVKGDEGINIDLDTNKDGPPASLSLGSRSELQKLVADSLKLVTEVEKLAKNYGQINDTIMKTINDVDKIIKDIDAIKMENLGKYKTVLMKKVKERLSLMKSFFTNYNKINKNLFGLVLDACEGNIAYAVTSLKYFGKE